MKELNKLLLRRSKIHDILINALKIVELRKIVGYIITAYEMSLLIIKHGHKQPKALVGDAISIMKEAANAAIGISQMNKLMLFKAMARILIVMRKYTQKHKL